MLGNPEWTVCSLGWRQLTDTGRAWLVANGWQEDSKAVMAAILDSKPPQMRRLFGLYMDKQWLLFYPTSDDISDVLTQLGIEPPQVREGQDE